ncbi:MAG: DUF6491 family protein [Pseudomonadota bacterium]
MQKLIMLSAALSMMVFKPALAEDAQTPDAQAKPAQNCVQIVRLRQSHVLDDQTIVFEARGSDYYLNELPQRCPRLGFEKSFTYATSLTQLCNVDIVTVLQNFGGQFVRGASCGLGKFQPISKAEFADLRAQKRSKKKAGAAEQASR